MLRERARRSGVWGNHDFVLCRNVDRSLPHPLRLRSPVLDFMAGRSPTLIVEDCRHFSHLEPLGDPHDVSHLWSLKDKPFDFMELASLSFAAVDHRLFFIGHYHRWWAGTSEEQPDWAGDQPWSSQPASGISSWWDRSWEDAAAGSTRMRTPLLPLRI